MKAAPQDIVLFHVGGSLGSYGPIDAVIHKFPRQCVVVGFEARAEESDQTVDSTLTPLGVRLHLINAFIGEEEGATQPFHINRHGESSSGLPANPEAADEICPVPYYPLSAKWGVNTELERKEAFTTRNLETLIGELGVVPDVLSIDAQGMELMILRGTGRWLQDIPALVTEVEFFPIYAGQGLFSDQEALLKAKGFRLADLLNPQWWHPRVQTGKGLFTVAEALWFKRVDAFFADADRDPGLLLKGIKFAAIASSFEYDSVAYLVLEGLMARFGPEVAARCREFGYDSLLELHDRVREEERVARVGLLPTVDWLAHHLSPGTEGRGAEAQAAGLLEQFRGGSRPVVAMPAGGRTRGDLVPLLSAHGLIPSYLVDNDPARQGTTLLDCPVHGPDRLEASRPRPFVFVSTGPYAGAIANQLQALGFREQVDFTYA